MAHKHVPLLTLVGLCLTSVGCDTPRTPDASPAEGGIWPTTVPSSAPDGDDADDGGDGPTGDAEETCSPAPPAFAYSLCVCEDLGDMGNLFVGPGGAEHAFVGVNGQTTLTGNVRIDGSAVLYGGARAWTNLEVSHHLATTGDLAIEGIAGLGGDVDVGGDLQGTGILDIGGAMRVQGQEQLVGLTSFDSRGDYQQPPLPCGCDTPLVDTVALVEAARAQHDNAAVDLPTQLDLLGNQSYRLPTGRYFLEGSTLTGNTHLVVEGAVSLFVDGSLELVGNEWIELAPGAMLDLYVSGTLATLGNVVVGDPERAGAFRLFLGGAGSTQVATGNQGFFGAIYAPQTRLSYTGNTVITGAVFAQTFSGLGNVWIEYAAPADFPQEACDDGSDDGDDDECVPDPEFGGCQPGDGPVPVP